LLLVCEELGNSEGDQMVVRLTEGEASLSNVAECVKSLERIGSSCDEEILFIASHFFEMSALSLESLSYGVLREVVCHCELKLTNEDSVFELLSKQIRASGDDRFFDLLEFVRFELLSLDCFKEYFELVSAHFSQFTVSH
jgi:hypothetical protein